MLTGDAKKQAQIWCRHIGGHRDNKLADVAADRASNLIELRARQVRSTQVAEAIVGKRRCRQIGPEAMLNAARIDT